MLQDVACESVEFESTLRYGGSHLPEDNQRGVALLKYKRPLTNSMTKNLRIERNIFKFYYEDR